MFAYVFCVLVLLNVFIRDIRTTADVLRCADEKGYDCSRHKVNGDCDNDDKLLEMGYYCPVTCGFCEPEPETRRRPWSRKY
ncbi:hypothetical protein Y032_0033g2694 [Ancylostoma ceylanicum]|uniref:ShKT domain-containing protein n=1 Tax=Ancylostoma ceylanicum TaxID=53326 RepID=A0A016UNP9_9BILA|nr:hypothetical protein Y032_0033g2694 [Ancylostoma ceylanicum]